ncbi:ATP-binding protein [Actinomadura sp. HBU206391]|uniref:ATP-binding protein n=1 Tax=Actinomadura sp. HBU206391 TaxID=2731692 RepID=UPI0016509197|nr:ATP-binding protein [Actinomadura sp. HBU206391]MBC6462093.1 ATP-binding protein [Actinomadura sp. HBU206391]
MPLTSTALASGPLHWRRTFPGDAEEVATARRLVAMLLHDCDVLDDVLLAADELVANALRHTKSGQPGGSVTVEIDRSPRTVAIAVTDQGGPTEPVAVEATELAESGRGLRTVSVLADRWGWFGNSEGRTVAVVFDVAAAGRDGA